MRPSQARTGLPLSALLALLTLSILGQSGCLLRGSPTADPLTFCMEASEWACEREWAAGRINDAEREACFFNISCVRASWQAGCDPPNEVEAAVCIDALSDPSRLGTPTGEIPECSPSAVCQTIEINLSSP